MKRYPRLLKRNSTYYIRVIIPEKIQFLVKKKEIKYSLNSNNYYEALQRLRSESFKIDRFFDVMELMAMEIKNKQLILTDADVHKMIIEKLKSVNRQIDLAYLDIRSNRKGLKPDNYTTFQPKELVEDVFIHSGSDEDYQKFITENHIRNYLKDIKFDKRTDANLSYVLKHLRENGITIPQDADYFKLAMVNLVLVDEYIKQRFSDIQNNTNTPTTPQIQRYLDAINLEQNQEALHHPRLNVTIKQLKDEFIQYRRDKLKD